MSKISHIGLIPDGNRRWAIKQSLDYYSAYKITMNNIIAFIKHYANKNIKNVSIYMLSSENLKRNREDLNSVIKAEVYFIRNLLPALSSQFECAIFHAGEMSLLPKELRCELHNITNGNRMKSEINIYLLIGYNPIDEIDYATNKTKNKKIAIENFWVPEYVDIVMRTAGGPSLLSNFLPLQCGYAQIYMIKKYFNDCIVEDFDLVYEKASSVNMLHGK